MSQATRVMKDLEPLICCYCNKEILDLNLGLFAEVLQREGTSGTNSIIDVYWAHKGSCDRSLQDALPKGQFTKWEDLSDATIPLTYMKIVMATMNRMRRGDDVWSEEAFKKWKQLLLFLCQYVMRATTPEEWERLERLADLPAGL